MTPRCERHVDRRVFVDPLEAFEQADQALDQAAIVLAHPLKDLPAALDTPPPLPATTIDAVQKLEVLPLHPHAPHRLLIFCATATHDLARAARIATHAPLSLQFGSRLADLLELRYSGEDRHDATRDPSLQSRGQARPARQDHVVKVRRQIQSRQARPHATTLAGGFPGRRRFLTAAGIRLAICAPNSPPCRRGARPARSAKVDDSPSRRPPVDSVGLAAGGERRAPFPRGGRRGGRRASDAPLPR